MAGDAGDTHRKHRRSSDEEKSSKRHKHRHHRHRHSKKREDEDKIDCEEAVPHQLPAVRNGLLPIYDVEEGEILEEDGFDVEFGFVEHEAREGSIKPKLGDCVEGHLIEGEVRHISSPSMEEKAKRKHSNLKTVREDWNGDYLTNDLNKEDKMSSRHKFSNKMIDEVALRRHPSVEPKNELLSVGSKYDRGSGHMSLRPRNVDKSKRYHHSDHVEADESRLPGQRNSLSPHRFEDKHKHSPSRDRYQYGVYSATRSKSLERAREISHSHNVFEEDVLLTRRHHDGLDSSYHDLKDKTEYDSDEGRISRHSKERLPDSRDLVGGNEREQNISYNRYIGEDDKLGSRDRWKKDRRRDNDSERDEDPRREKERQSSQVRDHKRESERETSRDRGREREHERSRDYGRERELERNREMDHRREKERERSKDNSDHGREREHERSRDYGRERELERSRDMDHGREKESERSRDRERKWDCERYRSKDRKVDRVRRRGWEDKNGERENNRDGDRVRDPKSDRDMKTNRIQDDKKKYKYLEDDFVDQDRHRDSRLSRHGESEYQRDRNRINGSAKVHSSKSESLEEGEEKQKRDEDEQEDDEEIVTLHLAEQEEEDLNRIKEESRRRRQAILEKYKSKQLQEKTEPHSKDAEKEKVSAEHSSQPIDASNEIPEIQDDSSNGVDTSGADQPFSVGKSPSQNGIYASERNTSAGGLGEGTPKSERSTDMFCDDIFGESPTEVRKSGKEDSLHVEMNGFHDNWDDADGYYSYRFGEILDGRYEVTAAHGKGVFSTVVRAKDLKAGIGEPEEVAIKIIRNNDTMYKAGIEELGILKKLVGADPDDKRHCVRFLSSFKYRNHLCLVFESLHMNLRELLKKFGRNIGLKLTAVRVYAKQLFIALKHLKNCGVLHCDIKPDNMLVNEAKNVLKLCDFGNAMYVGKNEITPYLVSRFYRSPEIILGLPYDHPLDIWSVGCCLFELYAGKVLFPGHTNNDMLRLHMELKGPFPKKMLRKGGFIDQHFDQDLNFLATEDDPVTKKIIRRTLFNIKPKDIGSIISGSSGEDPKMFANFKDLLEKIFMLDPEKRMTVSQALSHPFITGK